MNLHLLTTKIPHHSAHSGYEQLVNYIHEARIYNFPRGHGNSFLKHNFERVVRRLACSKWYQWDGIEFEKYLYQQARTSSADQPVIAHMLYGDTSIGLIPYVKNSLNLKLVLTVHTCPSDMDEVFQRADLLHKVDAFILLGGNQVPFFKKLGIPLNRLHIIPHGVDTQYYKPDVEVKEPGTPNNVLMVGNWRRNFDWYREIIGSFEEDDSIHFNIISHDHNASLFRDFKNVTFESNISDDRLLQKYQQSDMLLLGLEDAVANNVLVEAMATKLPVIVERVGAIPEYISEEEGWLCEPKNVDEARAGILQISDRNQQVLVDQKTEKAYKRAKSVYSWQAIAERTMEVYRRL